MRSKTPFKVKGWYKKVPPKHVSWIELSKACLLMVVLKRSNWDLLLVQCSATVPRSSRRSSGGREAASAAADINFPPPFDNEKRGAFLRSAESLTTSLERENSRITPRTDPFCSTLFLGFLHQDENIMIAHTMNELKVAISVVLFFVNSEGKEWKCIT